MTKVVPLMAPPTVLDTLSSHVLPTTSHRHRERLINVCGMLYIVLTVACSWCYLRLILDENATNDLWWPQFNTTGGQTFLADVFNSHLHLGVSGDFALMGAAMPKDYSKSSTSVDMRPSEARHFLLSDLPLEAAISAIRANTLTENIQVTNPHCWVDLDRQFPMASTAKRQHRCDARMKTNAAVYLETMLRNVNASDLVQSRFSAALNATVLEPLLGVPGGRQWVDALARHVWINISDEAALWRTRYNLTAWTIQFQNRFDMGMTESIVIVNALGTKQEMTIQSLSYRNRGLAAWSTRWLFPGFWNDLSECSSLGLSLVRTSPLHGDNVGWDRDLYYNGPFATNGTLLVRSHIGPLESIDVIYSHIPTALVAFFHLFQDAIINQPDAIPTLPFDTFVDPVPSRWVFPGDTEFYGGSPFCPFVDPVPYIQPSFGYYDDCGAKQVLLVELRPFLVTFAYSALNTSVHDITSICSICYFYSKQCTDALTRLHPFHKSLGIAPTPLLSDAIAAAHALNITFIQWATTHTNGTPAHRMLTQPILEGEWAFFGWMAIMDWLLGRREVCTFEGDEGRVTLISRLHAFVPLDSNPLELPNQACFYLSLIATYTSCMLVFVSALVLLYGVVLERGSFNGWHLFRFNRVVGVQWVGRPLLFLRGVTAAIILSTSATSFESRGGITRFAFVPRPLLQRAILAGESIWMSYVLHDTLLPVTGGAVARAYAPLGSLMAFVGILAWEIVAPVEVDATIGRKCVINSLLQGIECMSGHVQIGYPTRLGFVCCVQLGASVVAFFIARTTSAKETVVERHLAIPGASVAFFPDTSVHRFYLDSVACVMSGLLPFGDLLVDIKLWDVFQNKASAHGIKFLPPHFTVRSSLGKPIEGTLPKFSSRRRYLAVACLAYMVATVASSYAFLVLTTTTLANDFFWVSFDGAATQAFLCNWFNRRLQVRAAFPTIQLDDPHEGLLVATTNITTTTVATSPLYASSIQHEVLKELPQVIASLRAMDGCVLPWIFTSYCFVSFDRQWEMAPTVARQDRCYAFELANGAVYLESMLRNGDWNSLGSCWGDQLRLGVFDHLETTAEGRAWLARTLASERGSIADEVAWWRQHNVTSYETQWQNYKSLGIVETFSVQNALGFTYPLTLKSSNSSLQLSTETSNKLYWGFGNDLLFIVGLNGSLPGVGSSLVRASSVFAFANVSFSSILAMFSVVSAPLGPGFALFQDTIGPFGSVDVKRLPPPEPLCNLHELLSKTVMAVLTADAATQRAFWPMYDVYAFKPRFEAWDAFSLRGGNLLCELNPTDSSGALPGVYYSVKGSCGINLWETVVGDTSDMVKAVLATGLGLATYPTHYRAVCGREFASPDTCRTLLNATLAFLDVTMPAAQRLALTSAAAAVRPFVSHVTLVQYALPLSSRPDASDYVISQRALLDETEAAFAFFGWLYLLAWVDGSREVVSIAGAHGNVTTMSSSDGFVQMDVNRMEVPLNVAFYMRVLLQYITFVLGSVGAVVGLYILTGDATTEPANMLAFNQVAAFVWVGRPLILLRGVTAICFLSTADLQLVTPHVGLVAYFRWVPPHWFKTLLSAGELNWFVYTLNDFFSVFTKHHTSGYSTSSSALVWICAAVWGLQAPVQPAVRIQRACKVVAVDFQLECHSGVVEIGRFERFCYFILLATALSFACYLVERLRHGRQSSSLPDRRSSFLLYSSATYQFSSTVWSYNGVHYLDKPSAVLNGVLTLEYRGIMYIMDIKAWRVYAISRNRLGLNDPFLPSHLLHALPLVD